MQHLLILDYQTDAERKRIDYIIEKWAGRANISVTKPRGIVVLFEGEDLAGFVEDVFSRLETGAAPPKVFSLAESSPSVAPRVRRLSFTTGRSAEIVEDFVSYLLAKQNAVFEYSDRAGKIYAARTRKGHVQVTVTMEGGKEVRCGISVEGYGDGVDFIAGRIEDEMKVFLGGR